MEIDMNEYKPRTELKNNAKDILTGKYASTILLIFMRGIFVMFLSSLTVSINRQLAAIIMGLTNTTENNSVIMVLSFLISLLFSILSAVFNVGFTLYFLNAACGRPLSPFYLFYGFQQDFNKSFCISAILVLLDTICYAPMEIIKCHVTRTYSLEASWMPIMLVAVVVGFLVRLPLSLGLSQCYFLMLDFPEYSVSQIVKLSFRVMNGHKMRLLLIEISFLPLMLICILTWGIGALWLTPYINMVHTLFFLDLMNPKKAGA